MNLDTVGTSGDDALRGVGAAFHVEVFARRFYELFNERRLDEAQRMVDPQALFTDPVAGEELIGRAGYREILRRWLDAFPDARVAIEHVHVTDATTVRVDLDAVATHRGVLALTGLPPMPSTGRRAQLAIRVTSTISNGLITASLLEFDPDALRRAVAP